MNFKKYPYIKLLRQKEINGGFSNSMTIWKLNTNFNMFELVYKGSPDSIIYEQYLSVRMTPTVMADLMTNDLVSYSLLTEADAFLEMV